METEMIYESDIVDDVPEVEKVKIADLHTLQTEPKDLDYRVCDNISDIPIEVADALDFETNPNPKDGERLANLVNIKNPLLFKLKTYEIIGGNIILSKLNRDGVGSGLSHGTMDYIYRIGVGPKVDGLLDNIDLAVGCLQRRCQIEDLMEKSIKEDFMKQITSIAGGTCILPLEAVYQSGQKDMIVTNIDFSDRANSKADAILQDLISKAGDRGVKLEYKNMDMLTDSISVNDTDMNTIYECTGFWEYLNESDRNRLLNNISSVMSEEDKFILTALVNNPQKDIFGALKFKPLNPHKSGDFIEQVSSNFEIERAVITPNKTYLTLLCSKK